MTARIEHLTTAGTFSLDGETHQVENNVWLIGDDDEVIVIDAPHDRQPILDAIAGRRVEAILCTHGHDDHVTVAPQLGLATGAPVLLHPFDWMLWDAAHPGTPPTGLLAEGDVLQVAGVAVEVMLTPGHSPGCISLHVPELGVVFSGDTLFQGSIGRTDLPGGDYEQEMGSILGRLLVLPDETVVLPGHMLETTIGREKQANPFVLQELQRLRGH